MSRYHYRGWAPYVSVAERRRRALSQIKKLEKKGRVISPVEITGRKIARTFWGKAWCDNLESYSDFSNRLPRGRSYVRNSSVMDLQIEPGVITSMVSGSSLYHIKIAITPLSTERWKKLAKECAGQIDSLVELLQGQLSRGVMELLCRKQSGLFPAPREISMSCSCPDWATMCKHVAATLYGVGARLDEHPELLFRLRQVDETDLIKSAGEAAIAVDEVAAGYQTLETDDLSSMFGIELQEAPRISDGAMPTRRRARQKPADSTRSTTSAKRRQSAGAKQASGTAKQRGRRAGAPRHGEQISARELTARGIPHSRIQSWLRSGVLRHSGERGIYLSTAFTESKIDEHLAAMKAGASSPSDMAKSASRKKPVHAKAPPNKAASTRPARSATGAKRAKAKVTARELTAQGITHSAIQYWLKLGVLLRTGERGIYRRTSATAKKIAEYLGK